MNVRILLATISLLATIVACGEVQKLPDDGFVDVPGGRVAFRTGGSSCSFIANVDGIAADRPVIFYDQLGSGYSDRIEDLVQLAHLPRFVEEIDAIRAELEHCVCQPIF
jgi:proline iminopeptidase